MPSSITHNYFCEDVYNKINIKNKIILKDFCTFGEGPDPYFFYNFHLTKKSKEVHKINKAMQHSKVNKHFTSLVNYIHDNNYSNNKMVLSYLYGQICHYVLDSTAHPYIIYSTGIFNDKDKSTYKYNGRHEKMEYGLDILLISEREKESPERFKVHKRILNFDKFNNELISLIDNVTYQVYGFKNVSNIYYKSLKDMKKFFYIFNYDPIGIKKVFYSIMDSITPNNVVKKKELSFHVNYNEISSYLNLDHNTWYHPITNEKFNYSFNELYDIALDKAVKIITDIDNMLTSNNIDNKKLESIIGNLDYGTGLDCDNKNTYKYFKY